METRNIRLLLIGGVVVLLIASGAYLFLHNRSSNTNQNTTTPSNNSSSANNQASQTATNRLADPCTYFTTTQVHDAFGQAVADAKVREDDSVGKACTWKTADEKFSFTASATKVKGSKNFDAVRSHSPSNYTATPSIIGDDSTWFALPAMADSTVELSVIKAGLEYDFTAYSSGGIDSAATQTKVFDLAKPLFE